jgi:SulP family sulfate permease
MTGAALILMVTQLGKLFRVPLKADDFCPRILELVSKLNQAHWPTLGFGIALIVLLVVLQKFAPKVPGALVVCVCALAASLLFRLEEHGFSVVGVFPGGLPRLTIPPVGLADIHSLLPAATGIALLTYTEGILLARGFAAKNGYEVDPNSELNALGLSNICTGLLQGFAVTSSQSRTTINDAAGGKTRLAGVIAAGTLALFLLFLTPLIARLPEVALAAILIHAGFSLVEFDVMKRIYLFYPRSGLLAALTTLGVLVAGVVPGILIGVAVSLVGLINRLSRPIDAVLQPVPGHRYHDTGESRQTQTVPGLIAYRFYAPLLFSNAGYFVERVRELTAVGPDPVRWFLLDAQAISDVDVTAGELLVRLHEELRQKGIAFKIARANRPLREILERVGITREIGEENFFLSVHAGIEAFLKL